MGLLKQGILVIVAAIVLNRIPRFFQSKLPTVVGGKCGPDFKEVEDQFRKLVESGNLKGGSYAAFHKGKVVCDLWGGYTDHESEVPWQRDTVTVVYSSTKGIGAILAALMVDRGWLDYDKLVSDYWPGFGQNGKDNITVRMILSHTAGLSVIEPFTIQMLIDDGKELENHLARQKPFRAPGTELNYHAITYGIFLDRILRMADPKHRRVDQIFRDEIAKPFGIDFMIGAPKEEHYRVARTYPVDATEQLTLLVTTLSPVALRIRQSDSPLMQSAGVISDINVMQNHNHPLFREAPNTATSGYGNARSVAKLYGIVANSGFYNGKQVFKDKTLEKLSTILEFREAKNLGLVMPAGHGVFFFNATNLVTEGLKSAQFNTAKDGLVFGTPGYGGQFAFADPKNKIGMGFATNYLSPHGIHPAMSQLMGVFQKCFDKYKSKGTK